jgi:hypothetical protein
LVEWTVLHVRLKLDEHKRRRAAVKCDAWCRAMLLDTCQVSVRELERMERLARMGVATPGNGPCSC